MILQVNIDGRVSLGERAEFGRLHCEFHRAVSHVASIAGVLEGIAELEGADAAWIDVAWLRGQGPEADAGWHESFDRMIAGARPYGWVSADGRRVKAHVIWSMVAVA